MGISALTFDDDGLLVPGTYVLSSEEFAQTFCRDNAESLKLEIDDQTTRNQFYKPFFDICEWAEEAGATSIVIGGSFVSNKPDPADLDLLIFFSESDQIPKSKEIYDVDGVVLDIQLLSEDQKSIRDAYLQLLSTTRNGIPHGIVQIKFHQKVITHYRPEQRSADLEIVKTAYLGRRFTRLQKAKGVIIPIHGIRTHADWMPHLSLLATTSGWAIAPYVYGYQGVNILRDDSEKSRVLEGFRDWLTVIRSHFDGPLSIVAHSFGTYIIGRYLRDAKDIAEGFDAIILCGSILTRAFNWKSHLEKGDVGYVLNTISEEDEWVKHLPEGGVPLLAKDVLFGKAGCDGFTDKHSRLYQIASALLQHNNVFKTDVMLGQWMPFLEIAKDSQDQYKSEYMISEFYKGYERPQPDPSDDSPVAPESSDR